MHYVMYHVMHNVMHHGMYHGMYQGTYHGMHHVIHHFMHNIEMNTMRFPHPFFVDPDFVETQNSFGPKILLDTTNFQPKFSGPKIV